MPDAGPWEPDPRRPGRLLRVRRSRRWPSNILCECHGDGTAGLGIRGGVAEPLQLVQLRRDPRACWPLREVATRS
eukprot:5640489-Pyramimonas_sp.AAC.1